MGLGRVVLLVLGVPLAVFAFVLAIFAGGEGSPEAQRMAVALLTVPVAYLICLMVSVWLVSRRKGGSALAAAAFPFLYVLIAFVVAAAWPTPS
ncbi:hypothetical protein DEFR109230_17080 [Deinococcus frigens]